jgi:hypothetical protein
VLRGEKSRKRIPTEVGVTNLFSHPVTPALAGILLFRNTSFSWYSSLFRNPAFKRGFYRLKSVLQIGRKAENLTKREPTKVGGMKFSGYRLKSVLQGDKPKHFVLLSLDPFFMLLYFTLLSSSSLNYLCCKLSLSYFKKIKGKIPKRLENFGKEKK